MNIFVYILIFCFKVLENALGTLRIIIISNGKKQIGAILQLIISLIWVISTGLVVVDIVNDPIKILVFSLGTYFGSLLGSVIEEKLALGSNLVMVITNIDSKCMIRSLRKKGFAVTTFKGQGKKDYRSVLLILVKRKLREEVFRIVKKCDNNAMIIIENASAFGGYH